MKVSSRCCCFSTTTMIMQVVDEIKIPLVYCDNSKCLRSHTYKSTHTHARHSVTKQKERKTYFTQKSKKLRKNNKNEGRRRCTDVTLRVSTVKL